MFNEKKDVMMILLYKMIFNVSFLQSRYTYIQIVNDEQQSNKQQISFNLHPESDTRK